MTQQSDSTLVEATMRGDVDSFTELCRRYYPAMVAIAHSRLDDRHLAEDAAQETFAKAATGMARLKNRQQFAAWLAAICRNTARQMQRARAKSKLTTLNDYLPTESPDNKNERIDIVRRAVWKLRPNYREPLILRYYDNMPYERIAALLDISIQAVNGRLSRAKRKIAKHLKRNGFTGADYERL